MIALTLRAAVRGIVVTVLVLFAIFVVGYLIGDPARLAVPLGASPAEYQAMRESLGLNDPLLVQLGRFFLGVVTLDFGDSYWQRQPALDVAVSHIPATLTLIVATFVLALLIGGILGMIASLRSGRVIDRVIGWITIAFAAAPPFWIGILLILVFAVAFPILPTSGNAKPAALILPAVTLAFASTGRIAQTVRGNLLAERNQPYAKYAVAKGLTDFQVLSEHTVRSAGVPISTYSLWELVRLIAGASVVVEVVFAWPGIGQLSIQAVQRQDFPLVQACVVVIAVLVVFINFLAESLYGLMDPRIRNRTMVGAR